MNFQCKFDPSRNSFVSCSLLTERIHVRCAFIRTGASKMKRVCYHTSESVNRDKRQNWFNASDPSKSDFMRLQETTQGQTLF